jgi:hypothetical protein
MIVLPVEATQELIGGVACRRRQCLDNQHASGLYAVLAVQLLHIGFAGYDPLSECLQDGDVRPEVVAEFGVFTGKVPHLRRCGCLLCGAYFRLQRRDILFPHLQDINEVIMAALCRCQRSLDPAQRLVQVNALLSVALVNQSRAVKPELLKVRGEQFQFSPARCDPARRLSVLGA